MARTPATPATPFTPGTPFTPVTPVTPVTPTANAVSLNLESFHISTLDKAALLDQLMAIAEDQRAKAIRIVKVTGGTNALENALTPTVEPHPFEWFVENVIHDPSSHVLLFGATVLPATHGFIKSQPVLNPATIREASGFDLSPTGRPDAYTRDGIKNAKLVAQLLQAFCDNLVSPAFVLDKKVLTGKLEYNNDAAGLVYALCSYTTLLPIAASVLDPTKFSCRPTVVALSDGFFHEAKDHLSKAVFPTCYDVIALTVMSMRESLLGKELAHDYALRATKLAGDVGLYGSFGSTTQDARMRETSLWGAFAQEV